METKYRHKKIQNKLWTVPWLYTLNINNDIYTIKIKLLLRMCVLLYSSFVCISAYANVYFTSILRECLRAGLPLGFPSTAPPPVCVLAALGMLAVWILYQKKKSRYWLLAWTRVSANSEKGSGSERAVRVGQRLQWRFGQSGAARELGLVQIVVEASAIPNTEPNEPVFGWRCRSVWWDCGKGLAMWTAGYKLCIRETIACSWRS